MKKSIFTIGLILMASLCFAGGYNFSTLEEAVGDFEGIFIVKINDIKVKEAGTGAAGKIYYFEVIEAIKGIKPETSKAVYSLPPCTRVDPDIGEVDIWVKLKGSGKELSIKKEETYIMYFTEQGLSSDYGILTFQRVDSLDKKERLLELLKNER